MANHSKRHQYFNWRQFEMSIEGLYGFNMFNKDFKTAEQLNAVFQRMSLGLKIALVPAMYRKAGEEVFLA